MKSERTELAPLLTLLGDDDQTVVESVRRHIIEMGTSVLPELKNQYEKQSLPVKLRMKDIMSRLKPVSLEQDFRNLAPVDGEDSIDLQQALFTVARVGYPHLDEQIYREKLDKITTDVKMRLERWQSVDDHTTVETINSVIFEEYEFRGNETDFYDPDNCFINRVLQRRRGSPLLLSCLVLLVARRLDLPFQPVAMPAHSVVAYEGENRRVFIDPFHSGQILTKNDCVEFLNSAGFGFVDEYLAPVSNKKLLKRLLKNLLNCYHRLHNSSRIEELRGYLAITERLC